MTPASAHAGHDADGGEQPSDGGADADDAPTTVMTAELASATVHSPSAVRPNATGRSACGRAGAIRPKVTVPATVPRLVMAWQVRCRPERTRPG